MLSCRGQVVNIQAWAVRRLVSTYNYLCRRPHVPREREIRRLMISQGIAIDLDAPSGGSAPNPDAEEEPEDPEEGEEVGEEDGEEEEQEEVDEECEDVQDGKLVDSNNKGGYIGISSGRMYII